MAVRKHWNGLEILLFILLIIIFGCSIAGGVVLIVAGWAWIILPLALAPYVFQVRQHA